VLVKKETGALFVRQDEQLVQYIPVFTRIQIENMKSVYADTYSIPLGAGGHYYRHNVDLPSSPPMTVSISRSENNPFYGNYINVVNEYIKGHQDTKETKWILQNMQSINLATLYWGVINSQEKAELNRLAANLRACELNAMIAGKPVFTDEEVNVIVLEYGYDPEKSYGYR